MTGDGHPNPGSEIGNEIAQLSVWEMVATGMIIAPLLAGISLRVDRLRQPVGGYLYSIVPGLPILADAISYTVAAILSGCISRPLRNPQPSQKPPRIRRDLLTGLRYLWRDPFLKATLLCAAGFQSVFTGITFALIATMHTRHVHTASLGTLFAVASVGGIAGAVLAVRIQAHLTPPTLIIAMGWVTTASFTALGWIERPLLAGILLAVVFFTVAPANDMLTAAQIHRTPAQLQGRVAAASLLIAGIAAPLGPLTAGILIDLTGQHLTFLAFSAVIAAITIAMHANQPIRILTRPT